MILPPSSLAVVVDGAHLAITVHNGTVRIRAHRDDQPLRIITADAIEELLMATPLLRAKLGIKIATFDSPSLPPRVQQALARNGIVYIGELVQQSVETLLFSSKELRLSKEDVHRIISFLKSLGLGLELNLTGIWTRPQGEEL